MHREGGNVCRRMNGTFDKINYYLTSHCDVRTIIARYFCLNYYINSASHLTFPVPCCTVPDKLPRIGWGWQVRYLREAL